MGNVRATSATILVWKSQRKRGGRCSRVVPEGSRSRATMIHMAAPLRPVIRAGVALYHARPQRERVVDKLPAARQIRRPQGIRYATFCGSAASLSSPSYGACCHSGARYRSCGSVGQQQWLERECRCLREWIGCCPEHTSQ